MIWGHGSFARIQISPTVMVNEEQGGPLEEPHVKELE